MKNKKIIISLIVVSVIFVAGCGTKPKTVNPVTTTPTGLSTEVATNNTVTILNFSFSPSSLTIKKGESVTWLNEDSAPHAINFETFSSDTFSKGESYSKTFNEAGSFNYYCSIHPSMIGKIIVE